MEAAPVPRSWKDITSGYRFSLVSGAFACLVTLIVNISVTIWVAKLPDVDGDSGGRRVLYEGSCSKSKTINTGLHVLINLLSSVLLSASNYGIQCLSAPTREQVDKAHHQDDYLDIGVVSLGNLSHQTHLTRALWFTLFLSSLPLHLLYNSVVFSSLTVPSSYEIIHADERLMSSKEILESEFEIIPSEAQANPDQEEHIRILLEESFVPKAFEYLNASDCVSEYGVGFLTSRRDVILVHEAVEDANVTLFSTAHPGNWETFEWICFYREGFNTGACRVLLKTIRADIDNWRPYGDMLGSSESGGKVRIKYCLSKPMSQLCRVNFNVLLAVVVVLSNLVKMVVLTYVALYLAPDRLLVLGDSIQSYISCPDLRSRDNCLLGAHDVQSGDDYLESTYDQRRWMAVKPLASVEKRWISPVSNSRLVAGALTYGLSLCGSLVLITWGILSMTMPATFENLRSLGFGEASEKTIFTWGGRTLVRNVILANLPHLLFSFIYFQWNATFTSMLIGKEWNDFSLQRSSLRVSDKPQGKQRSRYFLQLPYKFSTPLIVASIVFHWLVSQSVFVISIEQLDLEDRLSWLTITCGYSPIAVMVTLLVMLVIPISVFVVGCQTFPGLMPVAGSCSLAIAAACHHPDGDAHPNAAFGYLKWGVMADKRKRQNHDEHEEGQQEGQDLLDQVAVYDHCGFSIDEVEEPQEGKMYA